MKRSEGTFKATEGLKLFYQKWEPPHPKGTLIITHGQAEHSDCYHRLATAMSDSNWEILAWDLRGHGQSDGKRGFAESFNSYCNDFISFIQQVVVFESIQNRPMVLLGHSMGALIQLKALINAPELEPTALVLSSPLLGLKTAVSPLKESLSTWVSRLFPELTVWNQIKYEQLSRDKAILKEYEADPLRHDRISAQVYLGMLSSMEYVNKSAAKIKWPVLMQISGADEIVSPEASLQFFEALGSEQKTKYVYKYSHHEIYNDLDRNEAYRDLKSFLKGFE